MKILNNGYSLNKIGDKLMSKKKKSTTDKLKGIVVKPEDKRAQTEKKVLRLLSELGIKVIKDKDDLNN